jgi:zinc transport system ATP-binding protein
MAPVIEAEHVRAGYGGRAVVNDISFTAEEGDVVAVLGPNGSGKTTLLKALLGVIPLREGRVRLFGRESLGEDERERLVSYIPQRVDLDRTFPITVGEMLALSRRGPEAERYVRLLELGGLMKKRVGDLSGGQMQRALLAYSMMKGPGLLIMDEPTSWIDARGASCILCMVEELKARGVAVLIVSHDYSMVKPISTHILGLGHDTYFFADAGSPGLEDRIHSIFGTMHHAEEGASVCMHCGLPMREDK